MNLDPNCCDLSYCENLFLFNEKCFDISISSFSVFHTSVKIEEYQNMEIMIEINDLK